MRRVSVHKRVFHVLDNRLVCPIDFALQNLAQKIRRVVVLESFKQRHVQLTLLREVREDFGRHFHVVTGKNCASTFAGKGERHNCFALHCLGCFVEQDVRKEV